VSSLLTEELSEIELIYDSIRARLIDIHRVSELKELARVTEINKRIKELTKTFFILIFLLLVDIERTSFLSELPL